MSILRLHRTTYGVIFCALLSGCASKMISNIGSHKNSSSTEKVRLTYRTETDRINAAGGIFGVTPVSFQPSAPPLALPSCSIGSIDVVFPHPNGRTDAGQARLTVRAGGDDTAVVSRSIWTNIQDRFGADDEANGEAELPILEVWTMDMPKWQVDRIAAKLRKIGFFRKRVKVLSPAVYLAAQIDDGMALGKNYRPVPELDALILHMRGRGGQLVYARNSSFGGKPRRDLPGENSILSRLPAVAR